MGRYALFSFSRLEVVQLVFSTLALATAFSFPLSCSYVVQSFLVSQCGEPAIHWGTILFPALPVSLVIVVAAFVLHELAHKLVAQHLGLWAEFRASMPGLVIALAISAVMGVVVASPGVVLIVGPATRRDSGVISIAGPLVNIAFGVLALPLWMLTDQDPAFDVGLATVGNFFQLALLINVVLAAFNMLPVRPLDGSKIVRWSVPLFVLVWLAIVGLGYLMLNGL